MKKIVLLIFFSSLNLYPLTNQNWKVINQLNTTWESLGTFIGGALGVVATLYTYPEPHPAPPTSFAEQAALQAELPHYLRYMQQSRTRKMVGAALGAGSGAYIGNFIGKRLALFYIARKYGVDLRTAKNAIEKNIDLQKEHQ